MKIVSNEQKQIINNYFVNNADIITPGILGPWEYKIGNLHYKQVSSGFLGGGCYKYTHYVLKLNGSVIAKTSEYMVVFNKIVAYIKLQIHKTNFPVS